jgi:hypothetical protein
MLDNEDRTLHRCGPANMVTACNIMLDHVTVTRRDVLEPRAARWCTDCFPMCENCHQRPYISHVALDSEPIALCAECLSEISGVLEDENDY